MSKWVPVSEKKKFIRWFLGQYKLKKMETKKLFDLLLTHEHMLERIHFTDKANPSGKTILISTVCTETVPFEFRKLSKTSQNIDDVIHDIRFTSRDRVYIVLNFRGKMFCHPYLRIRENYKPEIRIEEEPPILLKILADIYIERSVQHRRLEELKKEIDDCLDIGDKSRFIQLTEERNQIMELLRAASS